MDANPWQKSLQDLTSTLTQLQQTLQLRFQRFEPFRLIYSEFYKLSEKLIIGLNTLADTCDREVLSTLKQSQQSLGGVYSCLKAAFLSVAVRWRGMSDRCKQEVLQPLKIVAQNYKKLNWDAHAKLKHGLTQCVNHHQELIKYRDNYYASCEKLEGHKESQAKIMSKIENGEPGQLQRFNNTTKSLFQRISISQKKYRQKVQKVNQIGEIMKLTVGRQIVALNNNEFSRVEFLRKIATSQLKSLETTVEAELKERNHVINARGAVRCQFTKVISRLQQFSEQTSVSQYYVSHEDIMKLKKNKQFQHQNPLLMQLFRKIPESQKQGLKKFGRGSLQNTPEHRLISVHRIRQQWQVVLPPQWQTLKQKICTHPGYLFYFCHLLTQQLNEFSSYYLKLSPPFYQHLTQLVISLMHAIQPHIQSKLSDTAMNVAYQLLKIGQRVVEKGKKQTGGMKIMIQDLGKCRTLCSQKWLKRLLQFLKKRNRKKPQTKSMINITKGWLSSLAGVKKQQTTNEQQQFNALVEMTHLMANLSLPSQICLPILKSSLKNNQASFQYLRDIFKDRKNRQLRLKILMGESRKAKIQKETTFARQKGLIAPYCILQVAQRGFFSTSQLFLRLSCKYLSKIHLQIVHNLPMSSGQQWKLLCDPSALYNIPQNYTLEPGSPLSSVQQLIGLDVNRSLHIHSQNLSHGCLKSFLLHYAVRNPTVSYCQGMNYLAGYVLIKMKNNSSSFYLFQKVINSYFREVFIDSFSGMGLKLYIFQRLLAIFLPDLNDHFKRQMIGAQCYLVGWIITAFTSSYQHTLKSVLIDNFWSRFVLWGWVQFYRLVLWLLNLNRQKLLSASYDGCLQILGEVQRSQMMLEVNQQQFVKKYGSYSQIIQQYGISNELLQKLGSEYVPESQ